MLDGEQTTNWQGKYSEKAKRARSSAIRELLEIINDPKIISFAGGLPASRTLPIKANAKAAVHFYEQEKKNVLQYGQTEGVPDLRIYLSNYMSRYGINVERQNILPTSGSQQALDLLGRLFLDEGDVIITSAPTYTGAIQAFGFYEPEFKTVDLDENGMVVDQVRQLLEENEAKFVYVLPNFHNPGGVTLSKERREELVKVAANNDAFIVEDDPYGELRFEGENITPILPLHKENVIYLSTFSKILAPGYRLGWVTAPKDKIEKLVLMKQGADLCTSALVQNTALYMCEKEGFLKNRLKKLRELYGKRRKVMLESMEKHFPSEVSWTQPEGGLFLWATLPQSCNSKELFDLASKEYKVAFVYGSAFFPNQTVSNSMRLNFSYMNSLKIREGIKKLGKAIDAYLTT